jgi:hypothetical protein
MITIDLTGKAMLMTGATGAIAEHMVRRLAASGATLILLDLKPAEQALPQLKEWGIAPETYVYHAIDITDSSRLSRAVEYSFVRFPVDCRTPQLSAGRRKINFKNHCGKPLRFPILGGAVSVRSCTAAAAKA